MRRSHWLAREPILPTATPNGILTYLRWSQTVFLSWATKAVAGQGGKLANSRQRTPLSHHVESFNIYRQLHRLLRRLVSSCMIKQQHADGCMYYLLKVATDMLCSMPI
jgi:hypothetical protein